MSRTADARHRRLAAAHPAGGTGVLDARPRPRRHVPETRPRPRSFSTPARRSSRCRTAETGLRWAISWPCSPNAGSTRSTPSAARPLSGALLESGLVDEVVVYLAPALLGDAARGMFALPGVAAMRDRIGLDITGVERVGADLRIDAFPRVGSGAGPRAGPAGQDAMVEFRRDSSMKRLVSPERNRHESRNVVRNPRSPVKLDASERAWPTPRSRPRCSRESSRTVGRIEERIRAPLGRHVTARRHRSHSSGRHRGRRLHLRERRVPHRGRGDAGRIPDRRLRGVAGAHDAGRAASRAAGSTSRQR